MVLEKATEYSQRTSRSTLCLARTQNSRSGLKAALLHPIAHTFPDTGNNQLKSYVLGFRPPSGKLLLLETAFSLKASFLLKAL